MKIDSILDNPLVTSSNCHVPCWCGHCKPDQYYQCAGCLRGCAYCYGGSDEYQDYCDACWYELSNNLVTVVINEGGDTNKTSI